VVERSEITDIDQKSICVLAGTLESGAPLIHQSFSAMIFMAHSIILSFPTSDV
jgi:hypothetical protein